MTHGWLPTPPPRHARRLRRAARLWTHAAALALVAGCATPPREELRLIPETTSIRPGDTFAVGVQLAVDPGWHTYWTNPGDSGMAPTLEWTLPPGITLRETRVPCPRRLEEAGLVTFGYEHEVMFVAEFAAAAELAAREAPLQLRAEWLVCRDVCVPKSAARTLRLAVHDARPEPVAAAVPRFAAARAALPARAADWEFTTAVTAAAVLLTVRPPARTPEVALGSAQFFPASPGAVDLAAPFAWEQHGPAWTLRLKPGPEPPLPGQALTGVLVLPAAGGGAARAIEVNAALPPPTNEVPVPPPGGG